MKEIVENDNFVLMSDSLLERIDETDIHGPKINKQPAGSEISRLCLVAATKDAVFSYPILTLNCLNFGSKKIDPVAKSVAFVADSVFVKMLLLSTTELVSLSISIDDKELTKIFDVSVSHSIKTYRIDHIDNGGFVVTIEC